MFQIPSLALGINPRVWGWAVGKHVWNVPPTAQHSRVGVGCEAARSSFRAAHSLLHTRSPKKKCIRWHCSCRITLITSTTCSWDLRHRNNGSYQVHQAHLFTLTLTQAHLQRSALLFLRSSHSENRSSESASVQLLLVRRQFWLVL